MQDFELRLEEGEHVTIHVGGVRLYVSWTGEENVTIATTTGRTRSPEGFVNDDYQIELNPETGEIDRIVAQLPIPRPTERQ